MVLNREIASPRNLDLKFLLSTLSKEKHLFFSDFPHHQKFVLNIKNKQNKPPQQIKMPLDWCHCEMVSVISGSLAVGQENEPLSDPFDGAIFGSWIERGQRASSNGTDRNSGQK